MSERASVEMPESGGGAIAQLEAETAHFPFTQQAVVQPESYWQVPYAALMQRPLVPQPLL